MSPAQDSSFSENQLQLPDLLYGSGLSRARTPQFFFPLRGTGLSRGPQRDTVAVDLQLSWHTFGDPSAYARFIQLLVFFRFALSLRSGSWPPKTTSRSTRRASHRHNLNAHLHVLHDVIHHLQHMLPLFLAIVDLFIWPLNNAATHASATHTHTGPHHVCQRCRHP